MPLRYTDSPSDSTDSSSQQASQYDPPNRYFRCRSKADDHDIIPTVDLSIALHTQLYPVVIAGWMEETRLSAQLIKSRHDIVHGRRCRQRLIVTYVIQEPQKVFGDSPAESLSELSSEKLLEEITGYLIGRRPCQDRERIDGDRFEVKSEYSEAYNRFYENWIAERQEYLTEDVWELQEIAVSPDYRHHDVEFVLMMHWLGQVDAAQGCAFVSAVSTTKSFFEKFGFKAIRTSKFELGPNLVPFVVHQMIRPAKLRPSKSEPVIWNLRSLLSISNC